ncbi:MAG: MBL fold metallo-hydrolase [Anaerofustis stercorihominis]|nr:MBL fold metallo-hydrolase [Anaerofustis stercorihominis]
MNITDDIRYVGVNDHQVDLFEGQYIVPNGMAYNSYVILDEKIAVMDTVDANFNDEWLKNIEEVIGCNTPDYLIIQHMEPDHAANIDKFMEKYSETTIVSSEKAFGMMGQFFGTDYADRRIIVKEGDTLTLGSHTLAFVEAPMVHWPEVIVTYDVKDKVLFSADGFGKFGALDVEEDWACEARRYYIGIVGKYGEQVQRLLQKAATLDIAIICPTHGPVLTENLGYYLNLYDTWSSYKPEDEGIVIAYTSVYGNTKKAVELLAEELEKNGAPNVVVHDLARCDMAEAVEDAFRYSKLVLATTSYNAGIFPFMHTFINKLTERDYQNRTVAFMENGSWAPCANRVMKELLAGSKNLTFAKNDVTIWSALNAGSTDKVKALAKELSREYTAQNNDLADKNDLTALFNIGYGLYVVTSNDGEKDNGLIVNTVVQLTNTPNTVGVAVNKSTYSHDVIKATGKLNVNCLTTEAPFFVFQHFGFQSGRDVDKFEGCVDLRSDNGLRYLPRYINSFMALSVINYIDLGTHGMFVCSVDEARTFSDKPTMTYSYYFDHVKPKPNTEGKTGYVCKTCGWIYEGEELPADIVCPLCNHGALDFEKIQ